MSNLERRVQEASALLSPQVYPSDTERALRRFKDLGQRRRRRVVIGGALAASCAIAAILFFVRPAFQPAEIPAMSAKTAAPIEQKEANRVVYFADGSHAVLLEPRTEIRVEVTADDLLELRLASGVARFEVVPNPKRLFRVLTTDLRIEVLGTSFTVTENEEDESVSVHHGRVAVFAGNSRHELGADMTFTYDGDNSVSVAEEEEDEPEEPAVKKRPKKTRKTRAHKAAAAKRAWKQLAKDGKMAAAYEAMKSDEAPADVRELMLAADVARLTGHPKEAVGYLETVVDKNKSDPNAVLAAFTLGRILERELGEYSRCADAFRAARQLAPSGSLAEDALAHEAECRESAGQHDKAKTLAKDYVERHPDGRKISRMRRVAGIE